MANYITSQRVTGLYKASNERGFTLLEALIALAIFSIGVLAVAGMQTRSSNVSNVSVRHFESDAQITDMVEFLKTRPWLDIDGDNINDDPLLQDVDGDAAAGLTNTDADADYTNVFGQYTVFYNVANNLLVPFTQRITMIVRWTYGGQREYTISFIKARDVL